MDTWARHPVIARLALCMALTGTTVNIIFKGIKKKSKYTVYWHLSLFYLKKIDLDADFS